MIKIATSYFYQIRNFKPWMIPVSTAMGDPAWYKPPEGQEYYIDKRGIVCGLRYEPLIVQRYVDMACPCENRISACDTMQRYKEALYAFVDKEKTLKAFEYCANKFKRPFDDEEPIIVLMVHEAPSNPCSERKALQLFFECEELKYPIC